MNDISNILIVETDKAHHYMLDVILNSWGYATFSAASGLELLNAIRKSRIDLLVMDIQATRRSDTEVLAHIKNLAPQMPVILMTAYSPADMILEFKKIGAADVLIKPLKLEELEAAFNKARTISSRLPLV